MKLSFIPVLPGRVPDGTPAPTIPPERSFPWPRGLVSDVGLSAVCMLGGFLLIRSCLSVETATEILSAHLPVADLHPLLFWLRVVLPLVPVWALLGLAGLCCCGGAISAGTVALCGLRDGAALGVWVSAGQPLWVFLLRTVLLLAIRIFLSVRSRRIAASLSDPALQHPAGVRGLSPLMRQHLTGWLCAGVAGAVTIGLYTWLCLV